MSLMAIHPGSDRKGLFTAAAIFGTIGVVLIVLTPAKVADHIPTTTS
jgi:hypothetical protein